MLITLVNNTYDDFQDLINRQAVRFATRSPDNINQPYMLIWTLCALYFPTVYAIKYYYKDRPAFPHRKPLVLWNAALSIISGLGSYQFWGNILNVCFRTVEYQELPPEHMAMAMASQIFGLTKVVEFGDTFWLCAKKRPTIFLHLYHHITVAVYCAVSMRLEIPYGHIFAFINLNIHTVMYAYYAAAIQFKGNRFLGSVRPIITMAQLSQMFVGVGICVQQLASPHMTKGTEINLFLGLLLYSSYGYLFGDFFCKNYAKTTSSKDTLFAFTPICFAPITLHLYGSETLETNLVGLIAAIITTIGLTTCLQMPVLSSLDPLSFLSMEAEFEMPGIRAFTKKIGVGEGTWLRKFELVLRFGLLPTLCVFFDSLIKSRITLRCLPLILTTWTLRGLFSSALSYQKGSLDMNEQSQPKTLNQAEISKSNKENGDDTTKIVKSRRASLFKRWYN